MFNLREIATMLAALRYWTEEIASGSGHSARHYLKSVKMADVQPLTLNEIQKLSRRLRQLKPVE